MFPGAHHDLDACEVLLHTRWNDKDRKREPKLFETKWFDHRALHPVKAVYLMGHEFTLETRRIIRAHINPAPPTIDQHGRVRDWEPIKSGDILEPPTGNVKYWQRKITSLIRTRQEADKAGIPYDVFVKLGLKHWYFGRSYIFDHIALPEPGLLNSAECFNSILMGWGDILQGQIQYSKDPRFLISNQVNHPDVTEHIEWLLDQIARKPNPVPAINKFVALDLLPIEAAVARFGAARVQAIPR